MRVLIPENEVVKELLDNPINEDIDNELKKKKTAAKMVRDMGATGRLEVRKKKHSYLIRNI